MTQLCPYCHEIPRRLSLGNKPFPKKLMQFSEIWFGIDSDPDSFETQTQSLRRCIDCRRIFALLEKQGTDSDGGFHISRSIVRCQWAQVIALSKREFEDRCDGLQIEAQRAGLSAQERLLSSSFEFPIPEETWVVLSEALHLLIESPDSIARFVDQASAPVGAGLAALIFQWAGPAAPMDFAGCTKVQRLAAQERLTDSSAVLVSAIRRLLLLEEGFTEGLRMLQLAKLHRLNIDSAAAELIPALRSTRRVRVQIVNILSSLSVKTLLNHANLLLDVVSGDSRSAAMAAERLLIGLVSRNLETAPRLLRVLDDHHHEGERFNTLRESCLNQLKRYEPADSNGLATADQALDAAKSGNIEQMEALLDRGLRLTPSFDSWQTGTPLSEAVKYGRAEMVDLIIEKGSFDVNAPAGKRRPLGWACLNGYIGIAKKLLAVGADPSLPPPQRNEKSPLALAVELNDPLLLAQMLKAGATASHGLSHQSPLALASELGRIDMVRLLLDLPRRPGDSTALLSAAKSGSVSVVSALIEAGLDVDRQNYAFETPLIIAAKHNHADLVDVLIQANANPRLRDIQGLKAIEYARMHNNAPMITSIESGPRPKR